MGGKGGRNPVRLPKKLKENLDEIYKLYLVGTPIKQLADKFDLKFAQIEKHAIRHQWDLERNRIFELARNKFIEESLEELVDINKAFTSGWKVFCAHVMKAIGPKIENGEIKYPNIGPKDLKDYASIFLMGHRQLSALMGINDEHVERIEISYQRSGLQDIARDVILEHEGQMEDQKEPYIEVLDKALEASDE